MFKEFLLGHTGKRNVTRLVKVVVVMFPILALALIINGHLLLTPTVSYTYRPGQHIHVVGPANPADLLKTQLPAVWKISKDSFPIKITIPRLIEAVRVRIRLDPGTQPYVTFAPSVKKGISPSSIIHAELLDSLDWQHVSNGRLTLWMRGNHPNQKPKNSRSKQNGIVMATPPVRSNRLFSSIDDFRANVLSSDDIGVVGVDRMAAARVNGYSPSLTPVSIHHTLRGSHQLYVYAANETLQLSFDKIDLNRSKGTDGLVLRVARAEDVTTSSQAWLKTVTVGDDGVSSGNGPRGKAQPVRLEIPNAPPGVYLIDINTSEDVLLANLTSLQHFMSFSGRVFIANGLSYGQSKFAPVIIRTNGSSITLAAQHAQGQQNLVVGGHKVVVQDVKKNHLTTTLLGVTTLTIPKGDITIASNESLSFDGTSLLPLGARNLNIASPKTDLSTFDYILADYLPLAKKMIVADRTFPLEELALKGKTLTFFINAPGLQADKHTLGLKDIRVTFIHGPFPWGKVWSKLSHLDKPI